MSIADWILASKFGRGWEDEFLEGNLDEGEGKKNIEDGAMDEKEINIEWESERWRKIFWSLKKLEKVKKEKIIEIEIAKDGEVKQTKAEEVRIEKEDTKSYVVMNLEIRERINFCMKPK